MRSFLFAFGWVFFAATILASGCGDGRKEEQGHEESHSGASFKPGKGILFTDETRKILGVEITDVAEERFSQIIQFNVQVFPETHRFISTGEYHADCDVHGSGFLPPEEALSVVPRQPIQLMTAANETMDGFIVTVQKTPAHAENEVIVGVISAGAQLKDGDFLKAAISLPREKTVTVIPRSALLKTAQGTFVYVVNGAAYYRTAVTAGSESGDKIEIVDGLFAGDQVVTKPVETLWLIELRATKGGGHSH